MKTPPKPGAHLTPQEPLSFTFDRCLGKGGFGEVYLAYQHRPHGIVRKVAVKLLRSSPEAQDTRAIKRLKDEARVLSILDHPSILSVHELTWIEGRLALVTEYVPGIDLGDRILVGRLLPPRAVWGVIGKVAGALHAAWKTLSPETQAPLHLVHRDIKPHNIRLSTTGEVKLLDFGIAHTTELHRESSTDVRDLPFTAGYSAPETFNQGEQGSPADVYALGITAFRLLTGQKLFARTSLPDHFKITQDERSYLTFLQGRMDAIEPTLPDDFRGLLERMLAYDPAQRPPAEEVETEAVYLTEQTQGVTHEEWARATPIADIGSFESSLTGRTLAVDDPNATIPILEGRLPGGEADLTDALLSRLSPELQALAAVTGEVALPRRRQKRPLFWIVLGLSGLVLAGTGWILFG